AASAAGGGRLQTAVRALEIPRLPQGRNHFSAGDPRETSHATVLFFTPTSTSDRKPHLRSSRPCQGATRTRPPVALAAPLPPTAAIRGRRGARRSASRGTRSRDRARGTCTSRSPAPPC